MHVSNDGSHVALFDLLGMPHPVSPQGDSVETITVLKEQRELELKAKALFQKVARWDHQEISMEMKDDALIISLFPCDKDFGEPDYLKLIVPQDRSKPIRVESANDAVEAVIVERLTGAMVDMTTGQVTPFGE